MTREATIECLALTVAFIAFGISDCLLLAPFFFIDCWASVFLTLLVALAWRRFNHGMHPAFLFLSLLLLFQGGRLLAYCLAGGSFDPLSIDLADPSFDIPSSQQRLTLLVLLLSGLCIYLPQRLFDVRMNFVLPPDSLLNNWLLGIFVVFFPFHAYKNYEYFSYVRSHGGYLAIFQSQDFISDVGLPVRVLSQLCSASFVAYFAYERPRPRLWLVTALYCSVSLMELLIGLRGKVLLFIVGLIFLGKLKSGGGFRLKTLIPLAVVLTLTAEATAIFRENKGVGLDASQASQLMLRTQGVSVNVLESAIAFRPQFSQYALSYIEHGISIVTKPDPANEPRGTVFDDDLSWFLNPSAARLGFGTGGSYLAEGYIAGGIAGVVIESLAISALLAWCAFNMRGYAIPFVWTITVALLYLPRQNLDAAVGGIFRSCFSLACVILLARGLQRSQAFLNRLYGALPRSSEEA